MKTSVVHVRFDFAMSLADRDKDRTAYVRADMPCVPGVGETVNLRGNPFIVVERGWSVGEQISPVDDYSLYAFVRCVPAWSSS